MPRLAVLLEVFALLLFREGLKHLAVVLIHPGLRLITRPLVRAVLMGTRKP